MSDSSIVADPIVADPIAQYRAKDNLFTPSNIISAIRAFMVFPAIFTIVAHLYLLTAAICIVAVISDLLDGYIARKFDDVSEYGKIIDPLADKIYVGLLAITMAAYDLVPVWFLAVVLIRDAVILVAGVWAKKKLGVVLPSNYPGKIAVLVISLSLFLAFFPVPSSLILYTELVAVALMTVSLVGYGTRLNSLLKAAR
jgi:CDP-diacylglycerol--glycerol-3-phosphate 3-phosphatidyltransferase